MIEPRDGQIVTERRVWTPGVLLRLEGLAVFAGAVGLYWAVGGNWWLFAALLFTVDVFMVGYVRGPVVGSVVYNIGHTLILPVVMTLAGLALGVPLVVQLGLIWLAHIGMDRMMGYGLKYPTMFKDTHLQRL